MIDEIVRDKRIIELEDKLRDHERRIVELKHELHEYKEKYSELLRNRNETQCGVSLPRIGHLQGIKEHAFAVSQRAIGGDLDLDVTARDVNLKRQITEVQKAGEEVFSAANRLSHRPRELRAASHSLSRETRLEVAHSLTKGTERVRASKPKRIYAPWIISDHIMVQEDFERLYKFLLESEGLSEVSDDMRKLVEQEWPELVHKLPPKVS
jgi:hypothetical protein